MKQIKSVIGGLLLATIACSAGADNADGLTSQLRQVVEKNLAAYNSESVAATLRTIHTKSPEYASTQKALLTQFSDWDARAELLSLHYIGHDDEFAVARVKYKTENTSGEPFVANILDTMTFFHQEEGVWKYWSDHVLGVQLVQ